MRYTVDYDKKARKQLDKMDPPVRKRIYDWIDEHLEGCEDPTMWGKPLTNNLKGYWSYRVNDYRIIAEILDDKVLIIITEVGHRGKVYRGE